MQLKWSKLELFDKEFPKPIGFMVKFLIIMIIPFTIILSDQSNFIYSLSSGFLFTSIAYSQFYVLAQVSVLDIPGILLRNIILGLIVTFPGIYYNYKIDNIPLNKSYWKMGLGICAIIVANTTFVVYFIVRLFTGSGNLYFNEDYYLVISQLAIFPVLVMAFFVILPLIQRLAVSIASPLEMQDKSMREIQREPGLAIRREKIIAGLFWLVLCFCPFIFALGYGYYSMTYAVGLFSSFTFYSNLLAEYYSITSYITIGSLATIHIHALNSAGNFYLVRELYRYFRSEVSRLRLISVGLLATFFPLLIMIVYPYGIFYYYYAMIVFPLPSVFLFTMLLTKVHRPMVGLTDRIWRDQHPSFWWEHSEDGLKTEEGIISTPETPYRSKNDLIKVPIRYLLISKIKKIAHRNNG